MKKVLVIGCGAIGLSLGAATALANDDVYTSVSAGAELGGNAHTESGDYDYSQMFRIGAEIVYPLNSEYAAILEGESRYYFDGASNTDNTTYSDVETFTIGLATPMGYTSYGVQCGAFDNYEGFADLTKEFGLRPHTDGFDCSEDMLNHNGTLGVVKYGVSYDTETDAATASAKATVGVLTVGAAVADVKELSTSTAGVEVDLGPLDTAAKVVRTENLDDSLTGYQISANLEMTDKLSVAGAVATENASGSTYQDSQYSVLGAAYQYNEHVEFVTDYKFGDTEDMLFLRANVNFL